MKRFFILVLLFLLCSTEATGTTPDESTKENILSGIELLYNGDTDGAESRFQEMLARNPDDPAGHFYMAMVTWSRLVIGFWSKERVDEYIERIDRTISVANAAIEGGAADATIYFYLGGALGFKGRFYLMERRWLASFGLASDAIDALKKCQAMDPSNKDVLLGLGIFDYYTDKLSGVMRYLTFLLLHRGDRQEGLRKLQQAAEQATFSSIEAKSVLLHIYMFLEDDRPKALVLANELADRFGKSRLYKYLQGVAYIRLEMEPEYRKSVAEMRAAAEREAGGTKAAQWIRQALYLESSRALFQANYEEARRKLDQILSMQDPINDPLMIAYPLLKKGMSYDLEGKRKAALEHYNRIMGMENGAGAQFLAERFIRKPVRKQDPFLGY